MNRVRKWWRSALAAVALVIALQAGVSLLVRTHRVHDYLIEQLEHAFGRRVEVAHFNALLLPRPQLDAERVTVGEDPAFGNEYFLRADYLNASLRWKGLLRGRIEFGNLSLRRPSLILVRNEQGRWNLERWLPPAKSVTYNSGSPYGPPSATTPSNRLQQIYIDDGRVNFKILDEKLSFALISVSGGVEQMFPGRWQLQFQAQPWRSGAALQSTGTVFVRGDVAGTSARLQPAEIHVRWDQASLADLLRLFSGRDYGVRGVFALDATAKSELTGRGSAPSLQPGDWTYSVHARATHIHRWDLTERSDNPRLNFDLLGRWNVANEYVRADRLIIEAPGSNLRGSALASVHGEPPWEMRIDSAGIQAADLLSWYRAFQPGVDDAISVQQYFTGATTVSGWPLSLEEAAFSSEGGEARLPELMAVRLGALEGGLQRSKLSIEPFRISYSAQGHAGVASDSSSASRRRSANQSRAAVNIGFVHDFDKHAGGLNIEGHTERVEDIFALAAKFGRTLNHGWELSGPASAALRWEWSTMPVAARWNGRIEVNSGELQVAGLNRSLRMSRTRLEWKDGLKVADIGEITGFGGQWSGTIRQTSATDENGNPKWNFQLHADHLDAAELDRWFGPRARPNWLQRLLPAVLGARAVTPAPSDLVRRVNADGELHIDDFTIEKLKLEQVHAVGSLRDLRLDLREAEARWAGGLVRAKLNAKFLPRPAYDIAAELDRIDLAKLPAPPYAAERFVGVASGTVHLTTQGVGRDELLQQLAGEGDIRVSNVEFRGWDLAATMSDGAPRTGASHWSAGEGAFVIRDRGVVLAGLRLQGGRETTFVRGNISFGKNADLTIQVTSDGKREIPAPSARQHVLKISGPLDLPRISVEEAMARLPAD
jgi:AsmA family